MKILITGTSRGIGKAVAIRFLSLGYEVVGIDILPSSIKNEKYCHFEGDIAKKEQLPDIEDIDYIFNNAGSQNGPDDINTNLVGTINVTEKYLSSPVLKGILFNASASAPVASEADSASFAAFFPAVLLFEALFHLGVASYWWGNALARVGPMIICMVYYFSGKWKTRKLLTES